MSTSGSNRRARNCTLATRATEDEKRAIAARANHHGLSVGAFLRAAALSQSLPSKRAKADISDQQIIALALSSLGTLMNEVRRIEKQASFTHRDEKGCEIDKETIPARHGCRAAIMKREIIFLRDQCFGALGRNGTVKNNNGQSAGKRSL